MSVTPVRVSADWLRLREPADAAARSVGLALTVRSGRPARCPWVVHDLACGSGSMGRWLSAHLEGAQHWVLHDLDAELLAAAAEDRPMARGGHPRPTVETRLSDVTRLGPRDLAGASLVTASALLDLLTADELERLVRSCVTTAVPVLVMLSVTGRVRFDPPDPLDGVLRAAFNDHQRRRTFRGVLLGPEAAQHAVSMFTALGSQVRTRPSPWRLDARQCSLLRTWLRGWVGAAVERRPDLGPTVAAYAERREAQCDAGALTVTVGHVDLLATPGRARR